MVELTLTGYRFTTWSQVHALARGCQAAWTDYAGFRIDPVPETCPPTSHLWAWSTDRWLRIRPDGDGGAIVGRLQPGPAGQDTDAAVAVTARLIRTEWHPADQRATPRGDDLTLAEFHLIEVHPRNGAQPAYFVHEGPPPEALA